ncbi:MAG TPA: cytochrome bc complex cytochrome b subunit [Nitrospiria bacterium]|nr:cytochrome bc complex cytochrome b subunit [Nitrospiria bacterium]
MLDKIYDWIDERIDLKTLQAKLLNEPMAGGSRYAYAFGSCLLFIFIMQVVTGILLMFYYAPTADHAWESTKYIMEEVEYGWFILSFHLWGSSAMVMIVVMHMSQVYLWGAYKKPREMVWLAGIILFLIVLAFGFTGYLLPWDQRSYWATTVGVEIVDKTPIIGDFLGRFLRGGPVPGAQTLSRFFVIHVIILPLTLMAIAGLHLFFFRKAGPAGPFKGAKQELKAKMEYFFPTQVYKDIVIMALVFVIICGLAVYWPHELLEEASPEASDLDPEPEWYFLFLFQLLRDPALSFLFYGEWGELLGAIVIPAAFLLLLIALPFIDRNPERNPLKRPIAVSAWVVIMVSIVVLTIRAIQFRE